MKMDIKELKEKSSFLDFSSQNERAFFMEDPVKKVKIETITSSSDIKPEPEESCSQNEVHNLLRSNETINESEIETKINITEEDWWSEREFSCINDDIKDETHKDFYSTKPPSLCNEDVSTYTSHLSSTEDLAHHIRLNINMDSAECETDRKCEGLESVVTDISSIETSVCSEKSDDRKILSMTSSLKESEVLLQSNTNKQDINNRSCKSMLSDQYRKSYQCYVPKKCFKYSSYLEKHRLVLENKEANKCDYDKDLTTGKSDELIDEQKRTNKCNICNKVFTKLSYLKTHKLIHEGIKPHKCNICNKAFTQLSTLKTHKLNHEGTKPHKCNICNRAFAQLSHLKPHKLSHEGIKPHKCKICNKAFTQVADLKRHKLIHEGIKPHKCDICNKTFTMSSNLIKHKLIHEGIKPYKCNICNKAFTQLSDLKRHKLIHDGIKQQTCNICHQAFTLSNLKKHILIHEGK